ncbi:outer membrane protein assembly factor BamA [Hyphococcus luteus]|uniref:Outer membrane protein assembly factor BamA n=1 Tax=Hyphococcus luteus TaxID=2058213 RepID=A0A2S7JYQ4_9PROT|nr:outer membrane protein assembly factor BamA [Marinicaulis flavus]PQA85387.1 outer membrane protein assembly factor BamA [Marinicaulis flavus]
MSLYKSGGGVIRAGLALAAVILASVTGAAAQSAQQSAEAPPLAQGLFESKPAPIIQNIAVKGNQRIEAETVGSYLPLQPGMPAEEELLDLSLKTLFRTGLFSDVKLQMQPNGTLLIEVDENPIVNRVILEGNRRLKDDKITEEIQLAARTVYTRAKVQSDVQKIIELYRAKGRFAATVTPKVTPLDQNRIDVIYEIDEGPKTGIAKVNFIGNEVFTDNELRGVILTKESRWWRFFTNYDNYDPDRLEYERQLLREFYGKHGYADFQVVSAVAELTPDRKDFFITFTVDEGPKYTIGEVRVKTTLAKLSGDVLVNYVPMRAGQTFDSEKIEKAIESLTFATGTVGYAFVDVREQLTRHPESNTIDITFVVNEGPRVYVDRINIKGNTRTLDKVIRREIRLSEGDAFNRVLVDRSRSRIRSLGYFKEVNIEEKPGSAPDRTELDVSVEEQSTGSLSVGVGISSTENFIVDLSVEERNLLGRGQYLRFRVQASSRTRQVDLRFTQPYFLDRNLAAGGSIFNQRTDFKESGFVRDRIGMGLNAGFQVSEYGRGGVNYLLTRDKVQIDTQSAQIIDIGADPLSILIPGAMPTSVTQLTDANGDPSGQRVSANFCDFVNASLTPTCESRGSFLTSLVGFSLSFDKRDDPITPRRGWRAGGSVSVAGLGGDVNYYQTEFNGAWYHPIIGDFIGALKGRAGYIDGYGGDNVRLSDRFFEGASTFRGFEVAGVGPRYISGTAGPNGVLVPRTDRDGKIFGQSIGAKIYAIGSAEILLPLPLPEQYGIRAALFSDFGTVGSVDSDTKALNNDLNFWLDTDGDGVVDLAPVQDDLSLRATAGVTVSWDSPFGPVRFDFAKILMKEEYDRTEGFRFSAGTSF